MNKRSIGHLGEESAALYLESCGYWILGRNVYIGRREIDLIAENDTALVFVEVKMRRAYPDTPDCYGVPADRVDARKQQNLIAAADAYLQSYGGNKAPRIDVIEVYADPASPVYRVLDIRHYENAVRKAGKFSRRPHSR